MSNQPWKTDKWFVSPWNFDESVRPQLHFAKQIKFHDVTLRDGEQQTGVIFTKDDKIRIAEGLAEAGVHRIEAGMPVVSPSDEAAIKEIVKRKLGPQIFAFSRCMVDDVKRALDCGVSGIVMEVPSSEHINKRLEAHFHMDFGMGVANTIMALAEGVEVVHSTVLGIGERAGNTPMEDTALALLTLYGIDTGLKHEKFYSLAKLVQQLSG